MAGFDNTRIDNSEEQALGTLEELLSFGIKKEQQTEYAVEAAKVRLQAGFFILSNLRPQTPWGGIMPGYPGDTPDEGEVEHQEETEAATN